MVNLNTSFSAQERHWGPGWPNNRAGDMAWAESGDGVRVFVHKDIAELVSLLMTETEQRGYDKMDNTHDDWGYANRPIAGTTTASNHSWGLAVDLNASKNPYTSGNIITDMPAWMPNLWNEYGFRWGGDYNSVKDAMHYEFMGTPQDAKNMLEKAKRELGEEVGYEDFKEGWRVYTSGKQLGDNASADKKFGFSCARQADDSVSGGASDPNHEHPHKHPVPLGTVDTGPVKPA